MHYIYLLTDPRTDAPFYVGFTKNVEKRFKQHLVSAFKPYSSRNKNRRKNKLMIELDVLGFKFSDIVTVLAEAESKEEAHKVEIEMIANYGRMDYKKGTLLNMTDGGEGGSFPGEKNGMFGKVSAFKGKTHSEENKKKISDRAKKNWEGKTHTEYFGEQKSAKIMESLRLSRLGSKHSKETIAKISESNKGKKLSEEAKKLLRQQRLEKPAHVKEYKLISPDGFEYDTSGKGLAFLCRSINFNYARELQALARKGKTHTKVKKAVTFGWFIFPLKK